jgi:alpha-tubulin suppressor-like RCC1 family protein
MHQEVSRVAGQLRYLGPAVVIAVAILGGTLMTPWPALAARATQVTTGEAHSCALGTTGGVRCWGGSYNGQLGDRTRSYFRPTPIRVRGLTSGVAQITGGSDHTCALTLVGGVKCWGSNASGQLGNNTTTERYRPVNVTGLASGVTQVAAGGAHTCALMTGGAVKCWGGNYGGELGDGTTTNRLVPVDVAGLPGGVTQVAAGGAHTCALMTGGAVKCWGGNYGGELGDGTTTNRLVPVDVTGLASGVTQITTGGSHTCALTAAGGAKCWGHNGFGQLGDNTTAERHMPVDVAGLTSGVTQITAGYGHTCVLIAAGGARCWGYNISGQLGDNKWTDRHTPGNVVGLASGVTQITAGYGHTCALTAVGDVMCWGGNEYGNLGDNSTSTRLVPVFAVGFGGVRTRPTLRSSHRRANTGETIIYTATVSPDPGPARLTFTDGWYGQAIPGCWRVPVVNGRARCTVHYDTPRRHRIRALYLGNVRFKASKSKALYQTVF